VTALLVLFGGAVATYLLRVLLLAVVPPERLPAWLGEALPHVGPAVLAALIATALVQAASVAAALALLAAGLVAWRFRGLAAPMAGALLVMLAAGLLPAL
jgi:branched-subunit amino acid transport protein